jgi:hypothetical protein
VRTCHRWSFPTSPTHLFPTLKPAGSSRHFPTVSPDHLGFASQLFPPQPSSLAQEGFNRYLPLASSLLSMPAATRNRAAAATCMK